LCKGNGIDPVKFKERIDKMRAARGGTGLPKAIATTILATARLMSTDDSTKTDPNTTPRQGSALIPGFVLCA